MKLRGHLTSDINLFFFFYNLFLPYSLIYQTILLKANLKRKNIFLDIYTPAKSWPKRNKNKTPPKKEFFTMKKANKNILADLVFTTAQVVLISGKISFIFMPLSAVQIYMTFIYSQSFNILSVYFYKLIVWFYNDISVILNQTLTHVFLS